MLKKQALSLLFSFALSSSLVSTAATTTLANKTVSTPVRIAKNMVYGAAHGTLAASSGIFCFCAVLMLAHTGRGGGNASLNLNLDGIFAFAGISGGIPAVYGLYAGLKGVYIALEDSYYALTEATDTEPEAGTKSETN